MKNLPKLPQNESNDCGTQTVSDLLKDNYSTQCIEDIRDLFSDLTNNEIGGYLANLQEKDLLWLEKRNGPSNTNMSLIYGLDFNTDLYWETDEYLETLNNSWNFNESYKG